MVENRSYIVEEVIEVDELDEADISATARKQGWAEMIHAWINIKIYKITINYKIFWNTFSCSPHKGTFSLPPFPKDI